MVISKPIPIQYCAGQIFVLHYLVLFALEIEVLGLHWHHKLVILEVDQYYCLEKLHPLLVLLHQVLFLLCLEVVQFLDKG